MPGEALDSSPTTTTSREQSDHGAGREKLGGSLRPILRVIPPEAYHRSSARGVAYLLRDLAMYVAASAVLLATENAILTLAGWTVATLAAGGLFILAHDAAHGALFDDRRLNVVVGKLAMLPTWHVYEAWVLGHNRVHHKFTAMEGLDPVWQPATPEQFRAMPRWQQIRHRIEWSWLGPGLYYAREIWLTRMIMLRDVPERYRSAIRRDRLLVLTYVTLSYALIAAFGLVRGESPVVAMLWVPTKVMLAPFLGFCFMIGWIVHVHHVGPSIRWWRQLEWTKSAGQIESTTILDAPWYLNLFFHDITVHLAHHVDTRIPCYNLRIATDAIADTFPELISWERLSFRTFIRSSRACKLYDFGCGQWVPYSAALTAS